MIKRLYLVGVGAVLLFLFYLSIQETEVVAEETPVIIDSVIPETTTEYIEPEYETKAISIDYEDAQLLMKIGQAEAGNQGPDGIWLVMSVVMNRVESATFPDTITEVVSQKGQFSTYKHLDGVTPCMDCHEALARIEKGDVAPDIIGFENVKSKSLERYFEPAFSYREHMFYTLKEETDE